jgi:hypothetical protein
MSGPCTAILLPAQVLPVLLAASAIQAARAVAEAQQSAAVLRGQHADAGRDRAARQAAAAGQGLAALQQAAEAAQQRIEHLAELAGRLDAGHAFAAQRPAPPGELASAEDWAGHERAIEAFAAHAQDALLAVLAQQPQDEAQGAIDVDAVLHRLALPTAAALPAGVSGRLLQRIAHLGALPAEIEALARQLDALPPGERAELLASELRLRVQRHAEQALKLRVQAAQALVLEQSLLDLGYEVEAFDETLFVQGGTVHFRKRGWGDYMVRARVDARAQSLNFNVVRAVDDGGAEISIEDHLAEDRWCAEFPALFKALEAQGMHLHVTRLLQAGEVPVQRVSRASLPKFEDEEAPLRRAAPRARSIQ